MEEKIIETQIKLFTTIKTRLDNVLGENSYPISVAEKILYEVNKDLRTNLIQESKRPVLPAGAYLVPTSTIKASNKPVDAQTQTQDTSPLPATPKQIKAIYAVTVNNLEYLDELIDLVGGVDLSDCLHKMTKAQATQYLDGKLTRSNTDG